MMDRPYMHHEQLQRFGFERLGVVKVAVCVGKSVYDMMQPQIDLQFPERADRRVMRAGLHKIAAAVELSSPPHAEWEVRVAIFNDRGRVYLELEADNDLEAEAGLQSLHAVLADDDDGSLSLPGVT